MKKQKTLLIGALAILASISTLTIHDYLTTNNVVLKDNTNTMVKDSKTLSLMYETSLGSGEYQESTDKAWPTEGYVFNASMSACENGSTLTYNEETKKVIFKGNVSDKCYVYFDVFEKQETFLAAYIKSLFTANGENGLYLHDGLLANSANDGSYRYFGGNPRNYVCFGSDAGTCPDENLYRIIGVFGNQVKLIKADYGGAYDLGTAPDRSQTPVTPYFGKLTTIPLYYWNETDSNAWASSPLNTKVLNGTYLTKLGTWVNMIALTNWKVGGNTYTNIYEQNASTAYQNEITWPAESTIDRKKIGLMYVSDYMYGATLSYWTYVGNNKDDATLDYRAAINNNWMYIGGDTEWTITRDSYDQSYVFSVASAGNLSSYRAYNRTFGVRPSFYLKTNVTLSGGSGTSSDPYRLSTSSSTSTKYWNDGFSRTDYVYPNTPSTTYRSVEALKTGYANFSSQPYYIKTTNAEHLACLYYNNNEFCFGTEYWDTDANTTKTKLQADMANSLGISESNLNCSLNDSNAFCVLSDYTCIINIAGNVSCSSNAAGCSVDGDDGSARCS